MGWPRAGSGLRSDARGAPRRPADGASLSYAPSAARARGPRAARSTWRAAGPWPPSLAAALVATRALRLAHRVTRGLVGFGGAPFHRAIHHSALRAGAAVPDDLAVVPAGGARGAAAAPTDTTAPAHVGTGDTSKPVLWEDGAGAAGVVGTHRALAALHTAQHAVLGEAPGAVEREVGGIRTFAGAGRLGAAGLPDRLVREARRSSRRRGPRRAPAWRRVARRSAPRSSSRRRGCRRRSGASGRAGRSGRCAARAPRGSRAARGSCTRSRPASAASVANPPPTGTAYDAHRGRGSRPRSVASSRVTE